jgi:hypothetical protein
MFDQIFERSDALSRQLAGPLRAARLAYLRHRAEPGGAAKYAPDPGSIFAGGHRTPEFATPRNS